MVFQQRDVRVIAYLLNQRRDDGMAGGIGCVDDASMAMAAFACQVEAEFGLLIARERHAVADQPFNGRAPVLDDVAGSGFIAQSCASDERVVDVFVMAVARIEHGGNAALRPIAGAFRQAAFADDDHAAVIG